MAVRTRSSLDAAERVRGAVLAGAVGGAIGSQVESKTLAEIRSQFGENGVGGMSALEEPAGSIGDDTQLTIFTLEALVRGFQQWADEARCPRIDAALCAYWRWLHTQGEAPKGIPTEAYLDGWLVHEPVLTVRRSPSFWCLTALSSGRKGTPASPINHSSRVGPLGRVGVLGLVLDDPLYVAMENASLTHGHPDVMWSAGALALIVRAVTDGEQITDAVEATIATLGHEPDARIVAESMWRALDLAQLGPASPETLEQLGSGWVAHEALAYAVCCAVAAPDGISALQAATNHSGPSGTVASACGHIVGAGLGTDWIPRAWIHALDAREIIETLLEDVVARCVEGRSIDRSRYPAHRFHDFSDAAGPAR